MEQKDGKIILITSGIHGGEYPGIQTAIELAQELNPAEVQGALIILHPVNTQAFAKSCGSDSGRRKI